MSMDIIPTGYEKHIFSTDGIITGKGKRDRRPDSGILNAMGFTIMKADVDFYLSLNDGDEIYIEEGKYSHDFLIETMKVRTETSQLGGEIIILLWTISDQKFNQLKKEFGSWI